MATKIARTTNRAASQFITARLPFVTANETLSGSWDTWGVGILPGQQRVDLRAAEEAAGFGKVYVVRSYATPIAWWSEPTGWVKPDVKYSVTTSKHQGYCPSA